RAREHPAGVEERRSWAHSRPDNNDTLSVSDSRGVRQRGETETEGAGRALSLSLSLDVVYASAALAATMRVVRGQKVYVAMLLGLVLLRTSLGAAAVEDQRAHEIVDQMDRLLRGKSSVGTVTMQISTANWQRTLALQIWSLGTGNALIRVTKPEKEAGTATLKVANNIWHYLPKVNRTIKTPTSMMMAAWMGSHFTNDDLVKESLLARDYFIALSFEGERSGVPVYEFTLTPKPDAAVVWGKLVLEVRQADLMPTWERYYDENGTVVRELTFSEYKAMGGRFIPTHLVMRPADKPAEQTAITYDNLTFDVPLSADTFSLRNLER